MSKSLYSIEPVDYAKITHDALNSMNDDSDDETIDDLLNNKRKKREKPNSKKTKVPEKKTAIIKKSKTAEIVLDDDDDDNPSSDFSSSKKPSINRNPTIPLANETFHYTPTPAVSESRMLLQRLKSSSENSSTNFNPRNEISIDDDEPTQEKLQSFVDFECVSTFANPLKFIMLKTETFDKMMKVFCKQNKISDSTSITFKWYGVKLEVHKTPNDIGMGDKEKVNVVDNHVYNHNYDTDTLSQPSSVKNSIEIPSPTSTTSTSASSTSTQSTPQVAQIILKVHYNDEEVKFRIRRSDLLQKILDGFCEKKSLKPNQIKLMFDGLPMNLRETPDDLDMENEDQIDAHDVK